jgi:hypothetical protein
MKKVVLLTLALLMISGAAYACPSIGLFADVDHSVWCVTGVGMYPITMYVWSLGNVHSLQVGKICDEFRVCYPPNLIQSTVTWNDPIISVALGDLPNGLSVCYIACQADWFWIANQALWVTDPTQTHVYICDHPDVNAIQYSSCETGYPIYPNPALTNLYINYDPMTEEVCSFMGTESASWGAIKNMMD